MEDFSPLREYTPCKLDITPVEDVLRLNSFWKKEFFNAEDCSAFLHIKLLSMSNWEQNFGVYTSEIGVPHFNYFISGLPRVYLCSEVLWIKKNNRLRLVLWKCEVATKTGFFFLFTSNRWRLSSKYEKKKTSFFRALTKVGIGNHFSIRHCMLSIKPLLTESRQKGFWSEKVSCEEPLWSPAGRGLCKAWIMDAQLILFNKNKRRALHFTPFPLSLRRSAVTIQI